MLRFLVASVTLLGLTSAPLSTQTLSRTAAVSPQGSGSPGGPGGGPESLAGSPDTTRRTYLPSQKLSDTDGDLLPDRLERVLMLNPSESDTDGDGVEDFRAALAFGNDPSTVSWGNKMRVTAHSEIEQGRSILWVDALIHIDNRDLHPTISSFSPKMALDGGLMLPLSHYLTPSNWELAYQFDSFNGTCCRLSFRLEDEALLSTLQRFSLILDANLAGIPERTGAHFSATQAGLVNYVPIGGSDLTIQPVDFGRHDDPFWTRGRFCKLRLATLAQSPSGTLVEIAAADCVQSQEESACPATCGGNVGRFLYFPDLLRIITGS